MDLLKPFKDSYISKRPKIKPYSRASKYTIRDTILRIFKIAKIAKIHKGHKADTIHEILHMRKIKLLEIFPLYPRLTRSLV